MGVVLSAEPLASAYALLGVEPGAPLAAARRAYRRIVRESHPDAAGVAAAETLRQARAAYDVIRRDSRPGAAWRRARALDAYAQPADRRARFLDVVV